MGASTRPGKRVETARRRPQLFGMNTNAAPATDSILVACPQCHSVVRTPAARVSEHPKCPKCKAQLLDGRAFSLDAGAFATHTAKGTLPVLVDFWAPWCGPCKMMAPVLDRTAQQRSTTLQVGKVNTDEQPDLAGRFNIRSIPTLILFQDGRELARQSGALDATALSRWLDGALR
jgi:thioredoxin 2